MDTNRYGNVIVEGGCILKSIQIVFIKSNSKKSIDNYHIGIVWYKKQKARRENHDVYVLL